jgi:AcrR family transcriptional regulator
MEPASEKLLQRVVVYAATHGISDKSLREIAAGVGTSHRMLLYHFGSREGLLAAIVGAVEAQQRAVLASLADAADDHADADADDADGAGDADDAEDRDQATRSRTGVMRRLWAEMSDPALRPYVRLFFAAVGLAVQGAPGTQSFLDGLTEPWLTEGGAAAQRLGQPVDPAALRLSVAVSRGLLLDLVAGADAEQVDAAFRLFAAMWDGHEGRSQVDTAPAQPPIRHPPQA